MTTTQQKSTETTSSIHPVIKRIFEKRKLSTENIYHFFSNSLHELPDLMSLKDLDKSSDRIIEAIEKGETIGVWGDYDVDGTTSCALLYHFFKMCGAKTELFQPSRFVEGYGVHPSSIDQAIEKGLKLLITVDCGISNVETAEYAISKGIDLIITDHHKDARETMPKAYAIVNPNRRDETCHPDLRRLAGVGVGFALALKIKNDLAKKGIEIPSIYPLLQFVAIGTICDMAELNPMNLKLVRHGLKQMKNSTYPGILQFLSEDDKALATVPSERLSFTIGPMINSKGRLDHPEKALLLLTAENSDVAYQNFAQLEISNRERRIIQSEVFKGAKEMALRELDSGDMVVNIVYSPDWHEGVIGIVASKLVETFGAPAVVFTNAEEEGVIKASARSVGELNMFNLLKQCEEFYTRFGGHKAAAGLSMPKENFDAFKNKMKLLVNEIPAALRTKLDHFDIYLEAQEITPDLIRQLDALEPFGMGNNRPIFRLKGVKLDTYKVLKDAHVKWNFCNKANPAQKFGGISFNFLDKWGELDPSEIYSRQDQEEMTLQFTLGLNRYNGNEFIQLNVEKVLFSA
ncbi:MAG: single-stranded-DNA-specific exonuclease RecJ [Bacteriovoracaceae bacterium]